MSSFVAIDDPGRPPIGEAERWIAARREGAR